jgi:hypothetical protein
MVTNMRFSVAVEFLQHILSRAKEYFLFLNQGRSVLFQAFDGQAPFDKVYKRLLLRSTEAYGLLRKVPSPNIFRERFCDQFYVCASR